MYVSQSAAAAEAVAKYVKEYLHISGVSTAIVLGSGLTNTIDSDSDIQSGKCPLPFCDFPLPEFEDLKSLEGQPRTIEVKYIDRQPILVLNGLVHMNEAIMDQKLLKAVRVQTEMLPFLGVKNLILTCAAGSLDQTSPGSQIHTNDVVLVDGFVTLFAPPMPLFPGEFCSPEDALSPDLRDIINCNHKSHRLLQGGYAMVLGPNFESRKHDKRILAQSGAVCVGMSLVPECCIASLHGIDVLALAFITNNSTEEHSHKTNLARLGGLKKDNRELLTKIVAEIVAGHPITA